MNGAACTPDASIADAPVPVDTPSDTPLDAHVIDAATGAQLVQQMAKHSTSTTTSLSLSPSAPPAVGHVLVMIGANTGSFLQSVTGGGVATWTRADYSATCANTEIWYGVVTGSSSTITITCAASGDTWMWVGEWNGLDTSNLLDQHQAAGTNTITSTPAPGTIVTTAPRELVMLSAASLTATINTPGPGTWTALPTIGAGGFLQGEWYLVTSVTGSFAPSVGPNTNCWDAAIVSFRLP